jgi:hypothetical protein
VLFHITANPRMSTPKPSFMYILSNSGKKKLKVNFIENPYIDVSSTLIRKSILNSNDLNVLDGKLSNPSKGLIIENYRNRFRE